MLTRFGGGDLEQLQLRTGSFEDRKRIEAYCESLDLDRLAYVNVTNLGYVDPITTCFSRLSVLSVEGFAQRLVGNVGGTGSQSNRSDGPFRRSD